MLGLAPVVELLANALADLLGDLGGVDRRIHAAVDGEHPFELLQVGLDRRLHVGILQLAGQLRAGVGAGAMHLAERSGRRRMMLEARELARCQSGPSSAIMRRLTKPQPMGGAWLCSLASSAAYSGGSASGMVEMSCATFMIGPLRPPSAAASSMALAAVEIPAEKRAPAKRAATPPILAPTRA